MCSKDFVTCYVVLFKVTMESKINNRLFNKIHFNVLPCIFHPSAHHFVFGWFRISSRSNMNCPWWFTITNQWRDLILEIFVNSNVAGLYMGSLTTSYHSRNYPISFLDILYNVGSAWIPNQYIPTGIKYWRKNQLKPSFQRYWFTHALVW